MDNKRNEMLWRYMRIVFFTPSREMAYLFKSRFSCVLQLLSEDGFFFSLLLDSYYKTNKTIFFLQIGAATVYTLNENQNQNRMLEMS